MQKQKVKRGREGQSDTSEFTTVIFCNDLIVWVMLGKGHLEDQQEVPGMEGEEGNSRSDNFTKIVTRSRSRNRRVSDAVMGTPKSDYIECILCISVFPNYALLKQHICFAHYKEQLTHQWGDDKPIKPCPECGKVLKMQSDHGIRIAMHLGATHDRIFQFLPPDVLKWLRELEPKGFKPKKRFPIDISDINNNVTAARFRCPSCPVSTELFTSMKQHLSSMHYQHHLINLWLGSDYERPCRVCKRVLTQAGDHKINQKVAVAIHLGVDHGMVYKVATVEVKNLLEEMERESEKDSKALNSDKSEYIKCVLCISVFPSYALLKQHICRSHYKEQLTHLWGEDKPIKPCPECGTVLNIQYSMKERIAMHLGATHDKIFQFLPPDILEWLKKLEPKGFRHKRRSLLDIGNISNNKVAAAMFGCPLCPVSTEHLSDLKQHLSSMHYRNKLNKLWLGSNYETPCHICKHVLTQATEDKINQKIAVAQHLGVNHGMIHKVATQEVKKMLKEMERHAETDSEEQEAKLERCFSDLERCFSTHNAGDEGAKDVFGCVHPMSDDGPMATPGKKICLKCGENFASNRGYVLHLCHEHFARKFLAFAVAENGLIRCVFCNLCMPDGSGYDLAMVTHLQDSHNCLPDVMTRQEREQLLEVKFCVRTGGRQEDIVITESVTPPKIRKKLMTE